MVHTEETRKQALAELKELARKKGGECLSETYFDNKTKLRWKCGEGHVWEAIPSNIRRGCWCRICANIACGRAKAGSIDDARRIAKERGGECLSSNYVNNTTKLKWRCAKGHVWSAVPGSVKSGTWCPACAGKLPPDAAFTALQNLAANRGGRVLSTEYLGVKTKHEWKCAHGHVWEATPDSVKQGSWCPTCGQIKRGVRPEITVRHAQEAAKAHNGVCLSHEYKNYDHKLRWKCQNGHIFEMRLGHVEKDHWCPRCSAGRSERLCAAIFEYLTGEEFIKSRPDWLLNERGRTMELDGYCKKLGLAFEFHGEQHFANIPFFHSGKRTIDKQRKIDVTKRKLCQKRGVTLIEVPITVRPQDLQSYITRQIESAGMGQVIKERATLDLDSIELSPDNFVEQYHEIAKARGGRCLSRVYLNNHTKLNFVCSEGHHWSAVPSSIQSGTWCPICGDSAAAKKRAHSIEHMKEVAESRGGKCLSDEYTNSRSQLEWECSRGHRWKARAGHVLSGHWCPKCGKAKLAKQFKLSIDTMHEIAKARGGECLSSEYENARSRLRWRCSEGHEWEAIANSVRRGSWCPKCGAKRANAKRRSRQGESK